MSEMLFDYSEKPTTCAHCGRGLVNEKCPWCDAPRVVIKDEPRKRHRAKDEGASKQGAYDVIGRATSAKAKLLRAYATYGPEGCVSSDACLTAGLSLASGYRARVSELREQELIRTLTDANGNTIIRDGALGSGQSVDAITDRGLAALASMKESDVRTSSDRPVSRGANGGYTTAAVYHTCHPSGLTYDDTCAACRIERASNG